MIGDLQGSKGDGLAGRFLLSDGLPYSFNCISPGRGQLPNSIPDPVGNYWPANQSNVEEVARHRLDPPKGRGGWD
ncbi:MAG: hypothetical protein M3O31_01485, partial [Acidobacteriota bacterium]|nr:hypothetical protein [Acidobacteriota bacterium]